MAIHTLANMVETKFSLGRVAQSVVCLTTDASLSRRVVVR